MYKELGGRSEYEQTPLLELQEMRLSLIAEINVQKEKEDELKQKQDEQERKLKAIQNRR